MKSQVISRIFGEVKCRWMVSWSGSIATILGITVQTIYRFQLELVGGDFPNLAFSMRMVLIIKATVP